MKHRLLRYFQLIALFIISSGLHSCHEVPEYKDDPLGNFDALADIVGNRYCFFREKGIDWKEVTARYRSRVTMETKQLELFQICSEMLDELKDGHVNLSSRFSTSYYRQWWSDYPQDFNLRTLQQYYLDFNYFQTSGISYKMFDDKVAYMYYPSFSSGISEVNLDYILAILSDSRGLIIDIRDNGGGMLTNIGTLVGRFIDKKIIGSYIRHKTGPAPDDFSDPYPVEYKPAAAGRVKYNGPIVVLTNRSCFSAANDFVAVMKELPQVIVMGARTGGGGGLPFSSELPNGWAIRFSACPINDCHDRTTEFGIEPTDGYDVHSTDEELARGHDEILERAIQLVKTYPEPEKEES